MCVFCLFLIRFCNHPLTVVSLRSIDVLGLEGLVIQGKPKIESYSYKYVNLIHPST